MMKAQELIPHLFRTEYRKIVSVLCRWFGIEHIEVAEDLVSDTFLSATELWCIEGVPANPTAWLYTVAKNKTRNYLKRNALLEQKISAEIRYNNKESVDMEPDLSPRNIADSQLAMMFTVCNPVIPAEAQISLALNLLCGFGVQEIADAFLTNKDTVYKRISRAKEKLKAASIKIEQPNKNEIRERLDNVLTTIYLLFSEGYFSSSQNMVLRKDLCAEAMRLNQMLLDNPATNKPAVNALMSLMCFHASRFDARVDDTGETVFYEAQDDRLWDRELIMRGTSYLNKAATGTELSRYHLEAGIAYWHTQKEDTTQKWDEILQLYNLLLIAQYSPIAALNRTYALAKVYGNETAIREAEQLNLVNDHLYYSLLGKLYSTIDRSKALLHYEKALSLAGSATNKKMITRNILALSN